MVFNSLLFALFLPIVFLLYWFIFKRNAITQNILLLLASIVFYLFADWKFIGLLAISGFANYYIAKGIFNQKEGLKRKLFYYSGLFFNIGLLLYFKYFNFFIDSFVSLFNFMGSNISFTPFHILLPLGISFFTFQMIGYLVDVNNEEIEPSNNLLCFFTYLFYFPKILSGPIERVQKFIPQIQEKRTFDYNLAIDGMKQFLWGLFKKLVIAGNLSSTVNLIFGATSRFDSVTLIFGAILFVIQLYADFSGYSDMACGVSKLFGIKIINNFHFPFFSTNISEFWKKWHISLTSWLMDYIFTPLSFILRSYKKWGLIISSIITFLLVGIWHGANWTFIIFGLLHGIFFIPLIIRNKMNVSTKNNNTFFGSINSLIKGLFLFLLISLTAVLINSDNLTAAIEMYKNIVTNLKINIIPEIPKRDFIIMPFVALMFLLEWFHKDKEYGFDLFFIRTKFIRILFYLLILLFTFFLRVDADAFIYFQF